jgi:streptogramin lyase
MTQHFFILWFAVVVAAGACTTPRADVPVPSDSGATAPAVDAAAGDAAAGPGPLGALDAAADVAAPGQPKPDTAVVVDGGAPSPAVDAPARQPGTIVLFPIPTPNASPAGLAAGKNGDLWFAEYQGHKLGRITTAGIISEILLEKPRPFPHAIAAAPDGSLWFTATNYAGGLVRRTPAGELVETPQLSGRSIFALLVDASGALWGISPSELDVGPGRLWRINTDGSVKTFEIPLAPDEPATLVHLGGLAIDRDGNVWCTVITGGPAYVVRLTPASGAIKHFTPASPEPLLHGVAAAADGSIWFTQRRVKKVGRISPGGQMTDFDLAGDEPWDIVVGSDGNFWISHYGKDFITRLEPTGATKQFRPPGPNTIIQSIAVGPDGDIWFTDRGTHSIGRLTP